MSVPGKLLAGAAVLTGGTMLAIGGINNQSAYDASSDVRDSGDAEQPLIESARDAGVDAGKLTHAHAASSANVIGYGRAANGTLALGGLAVLSGVAGLALRGRASGLAGVAAGLAAVSAAGSGAMGLIGWKRYNDAKGLAKSETSAAQDLIGDIDTKSTTTTHPTFTTRDGEHILERDERIAARAPYDPSPTYARHTETSELSQIAERDLEPLAPRARYAAVAKGLDDINDELDFWGRDCQEAFAEAAGVSLQADGSIDVQDAMRSIDTNGDKRLSFTEMQKFERRAQLVAQADASAVEDVTGGTSSQGWYGGSAASDD